MPASEDRYGLAEGPFWDGERDRVLWVDINAGAVHSGTLSADRVSHESVLHFPETVGAVVASRDGEQLVAAAHRLYQVTSEGTISPGVRILDEHTASRLNDGTCDPAGRFLVGSLALDDRSGEEILILVEQDGRIVVLDSDLGMSNGLAFSPEGHRLYSIDTTPGIVFTRDYDATTGGVGPRHAFLELHGESPDGLCVDSDGNLWIAMWGAGQVRCYTPMGRLVASVDVDAPNATSVAFVGAALDTLLITTASDELSDEQRAQYPDSGRLFLADVGVCGAPVPLWTGSDATSALPGAPPTADAG